MKVENTNLQLYALKKAADEWKELIDIVNEAGVEKVDYLKERLAFITNCFGLSLSQLIGQNSPSSNKNMMEPPSKLFPNLLKGTYSDDVTQEKLKKDFEDFLKYYDAIRHFGKVKYKLMDELTIGKLDYFRSMTIEIWDLVISMYRQDEENEIEEFSSISEVFFFEKLDK
ncbi:MAG: hypothetical protein C0397_18640 [Odoribacter sp.]|nr:hypothetical protein [Odoribacter sp.]